MKDENIYFLIQLRTWSKQVKSVWKGIMIHEPVNGKYYKLQLHILKNEYLNAVNSGICHN